jgi:hypothetical protein
MLIDSILSEPLYGSYIDPQRGPLPGYGGTAFLVAGSHNCAITIARNAFIHSQARNPLISTGCQASTYNNVAYNPRADSNDAGTGGWHSSSGCGYFEKALTEHVYQANVAVAGPGTFAAQTKPFKFCFDSTQVTNGVQIWLKDNTDPVNKFHAASSMTPSTQWNGVKFCDESGSTCGDPPRVNNAANFTNIRGISGNDSVLPSWYTQYNYTVINTNIQATVLSNAGARPLNRDSVDIRVVDDVTQLDGDNTVEFISEVGGHPNIAVVTTPVFADPVDPHGIGTCGGIRTRRECVAETMARALEVFQGVP